MNNRKSLLALFPCVALVLAGCAPEAPEATPVPTASPSMSSPEPTPSPSPVSSAPREVGAALDAWDAYYACKHLTASYFHADDGAWDFAAVEYAAFDDSDVILRTDGLFYVYIEVDNFNHSDPGRITGAAAECILGGSLGTMRYELFGATTRIPPGDRDPNAPLPTA